MFGSNRRPQAAGWGGWTGIGPVAHLVADPHGYVRILSTTIVFKTIQVAGHYPHVLPTKDSAGTCVGATSVAVEVAVVNLTSLVTIHHLPRGYSGKTRRSLVRGRLRRPQAAAQNPQRFLCFPVVRRPPCNRRNPSGVTVTRLRESGCLPPTRQVFSVEKRLHAQGRSLILRKAILPSRAQCDKALPHGLRITVVQHLLAVQTDDDPRTFGLDR